MMPTTTNRPCHRCGRVQHGRFINLRLHQVKLYCRVCGTPILLGAEEQAAMLEQLQADLQARIDVKRRGYEGWDGM